MATSTPISGFTSSSGVLAGTELLPIAVAGSTNLKLNTAQMGNYLPIYLDSGTANAYAITPSPAYTSYFDGMVFAVRLTNTNTSATVTFNVNGLGTKTVVVPGLGIGPTAGTLIGNGLYTFQYNSIGNGGLGVFLLLTPTNIWQNYTTTLSAQIGTFTSASATAQYKIVDRICFYKVTIIITTNGTAAGAVGFTLPLTPANTAAQVGTGRATSISGKLLQTIISPNSTLASTFNYDNTYPGATGETLVLSGFFEI